MLFVKKVERASLAGSTQFHGAYRFFAWLREKIRIYENEFAAEAEEKQQLLAAKVAQATYDQILDQLNTDIAVLRSQLPTKATADQETALDMKYAKDRQQFFGQMFVFS